MSSLLEILPHSFPSPHLIFPFLHTIIRDFFPILIMVRFSLNHRLSPIPQKHFSLFSLSLLFSSHHYSSLSLSSLSAQHARSLHVKGDNRLHGFVGRALLLPNQTSPPTITIISAIICSLQLRKSLGILLSPVRSKGDTQRSCSRKLQDYLSFRQLMSRPRQCPPPSFRTVLPNFLLPIAVRTLGTSAYII